MFSRPLQTCRSKSKGSNPQHRFRCSSRVTRPSKMAHRGIGKLLKSYHLRPVKSMKFTFDPYSPNVRSIRDVLFQMHFPKIINTSPNALLKIDVKSDRSEPVIDVTFVDGHRLVMKTAHLNTLEILDRLWEFCDAKDPKKDEAPSLKLKSAKAKKK